jgi:hypothetical protein
MPAQEWQVPRSSPDENSSDPSGQAAVQSDPGWPWDIRTLFLVIVSIVTICGAIYEWIWITHHRQQGNQQRDTPKNGLKVAPVRESSPLYPWCPPERDECWR